MSERSTRYEEIAARIQLEYSPEGSGGLHWWKHHGRRWRNRVGYPRLTAEAAMFEALSLVQSINRGIFRTDPETAEKYERALSALDDLAGSFSRDNWARFEGSPATEPEIGDRNG